MRASLGKSGRLELLANRSLRYGMILPPPEELHSAAYRISIRAALISTILLRDEREGKIKCAQNGAEVMGTPK